MDIEMLEKRLKQSFKERLSITTACVVAFLISGNLEARDVRIRNNIKLSEGTNTKMSLSENNTDVIDIENPKSGISHNKYQEFNVGEGNNVIFNNSKEDGESVTGGKVKANPNLTENAGVILNEINGNSASELNGGLEVFGKKADLVIANENGIYTNGANFINTSAVTLSTGTVLVNGDKLTLDVSKSDARIEVQEKGLKTDGDYLNLISRAMEINGNINSADNTKTNIDLISGDNKVIFQNKGKIIEKVEEKVKKENGISISASELGSMYGKNISILSTEKGVGVKYSGNILATGDVNIEADGKVISSNIQGQNIHSKSTEEIINTGDMKAEQNIKLNAPIVKNLSQLTGTSRIYEKKADGKLTNRNRGIIYYDYNLTIKNLVDIENNLQLKKASLQAGKNIIINNEQENGTFENISGNIMAGQNFKVKGDFKTYDLSTNLKLEDILSMIKVDLTWEHRSLVDNAYFNGNYTLKSGSLLDALHIIADKNNKNIKNNKQYYNALKQIKDPTLNRLLSAYLGSDWKVREEIKDEKFWNKDEKLYFYTEDSSNIKAKNIYLDGKNISFGEKKADDKLEELRISNFKVENKRGKIEDRKNGTVDAENIFIQTGNFENHNTDITSKEKILINSEENIDITSSKLKAKTILLDGKKDILLSSGLSYSKDNGKEYISKKTALEAEDAIGVQGRDITLEATDLTTGNQGKIAIKSDSLKVKDLKTVDADYEAKLTEAGGKLLKDHQYAKESKAKLNSEASTIKGNVVSVSADNGILVEGSSITGIDKDSDIYIQSKGDTVIKNSQEVAYSNYFSDARGKDKNGKYRLVSIDKNRKENINIISSVLKSEGNINIVSKNLDVIASKLNSKKDINLKANENLNILANLNKSKEEVYSLDWGSGSINNYEKANEKEEVESTEISAENNVNIYAGKDLKNVSVKIEAADVNSKAGGKTINSALADKEKASEKKVNVGVEASGSVGFAGMGASGSINTINNTKSSKVSGIEGLLEDDNEFKTAQAKASVKAGVDIETNAKDTMTYKNNKIVANKANVTIDSEGITDIGNTDILSKKDVNISGEDVISTDKENTSKEVTNTAKIRIGGDVTLSNETVNKINSIVNDSKDLKKQIENKLVLDLLDNAPKIVKEVKDFAKSIPDIAKQDILGIESKQGLDVSYDNTTKKISETTSTSVKSEEGSVNVVAKKGDIKLKNTHIDAKDNAVLNAENRVELLAGEKKDYTENNGFSLGTKIAETIGVNIKDGANAKVGIEVRTECHGNSDIKNESLNSTINAKNIVKDAKDVVEDDKTSSHYKDERKLGVNADIKLGVSSNHVIAADGSVSGNGEYNFDIGKSRENVNTGEKNTSQIDGGVNVSASVSIDGKTPDFSVGTKEFNYKKNDKSILHLPKTDGIINKEVVDKISKKISSNMKSTKEIESKSKE